MTKLDVFISCGEISGDLVAAELLKPLENIIKSQKWAGVVGPELEAIGVKPLKNLDGLQVMGFTAIVRSYPLLRKHMHFVESTILEQNPSVLLLVDYPGFHLMLARRLREKGFQGKIIQYICPGLWTRKKKRIKILKTYFDEVWGILPFEEEALKGSGVSYLYTGNPSYQIALRHEAYYGQCKRESWGLFPGSRPNEIHAHLPLMLKACELYEKKYPGQIWKLCLASEKSASIINSYLKETHLNIALIAPEDRWKEMYGMKAALAVSGTVCLELALHRVPTLGIYSCGWINYFIAKYLYKIDLEYFTLPNIILKRQAFTEIIDAKLTSQIIFEKMQQQFDPLTASLTTQAMSELETKLSLDSHPSNNPLEKLLSWIHTNSATV